MAGPGARGPGVGGTSLCRLPEITAEPADDAALYLTLLHEFGHALGLRHLPYRHAVMYPQRNPDTEGDLTKADVSALTALCGAG